MQQITLTAKSLDWLERELLRRLAELDALVWLSDAERCTVERKLRRWGMRFLRSHCVDCREPGDIEREELRREWNYILHLGE